MNVSMDHMTVPLTLSAVTLRAHSPVLVRQDFPEMAKYAKVSAVHFFFLGKVYKTIILTLIFVCKGKVRNEKP